jgi:hypothetical protein
MDLPEQFEQEPMNEEPAEEQAAPAAVVRASPPSGKLPPVPSRFSTRNMSRAVARQQQCAAGIPARRSSCSWALPAPTARQMRESTYSSNGVPVVRSTMTAASWVLAGDTL